MPKLATLDEILDNFSLERTDDIRRLVSTYLEFVSEEIGAYIGTPLTRADYTDYFWFDDAARARALPYMQFNLKAGFVVGEVTVDYTDFLSGFDPLVGAVITSVPQNVLTVVAEQGIVRVHGDGLYPRSYYRMQYTAGFETATYDVDGIDTSYLYTGIPEWLHQCAIVRTSQLIREHYTPSAKSKLVDRRLADLLDLKARRFGPSIRPLG